MYYRSGTVAPTVSRWRHTC